MGTVKNIIGMSFGKLFVVKLDQTKKTRKAYWICRCVCGSIRSVAGGNLRSGKVMSCGCSRKAAKKHGGCRRNKIAREYRIWQNMRTRCYWKNGDRYKDYGGRGIKVCDRWLHSYENFLADMGRCPERMTLDRRNNDGNYEPGNCRWATDVEQAGNTRRNHLLLFRGEKIMIGALASKFNINIATFRNRLFRSKMSVEDAVMRPVRIIKGVK